jgi:hypothetical protein
MKAYRVATRAQRTKYNREYNRANKARHLATRRAWTAANREKIRAKAYEWYDKNRDAVNAKKAAYRKAKYAADPEYRIRCQIRNAVSRMVRAGFFKKCRSFDLLGCSMSEFKSHIERLFQPGMTWENYGYHGWHLDHVIPISMFDVMDEKEAKMAMRYTNLQPLWWHENLQKSNLGCYNVVVE